MLLATCKLTYCWWILWRNSGVWWCVCVQDFVNSGSHTKKTIHRWDVRKYDCKLILPWCLIFWKSVVTLITEKNPRSLVYVMVMLDSLSGFSPCSRPMYRRQCCTMAQCWKHSPQHTCTQLARLYYTVCRRGLAGLAAKRLRSCSFPSWKFFWR
jgi:hypothetical protein